MNKHAISLTRRTRRAFSLIEIVFAIGIIAFALTGILGLVPVAMNSATSSQQATQAAFIAEEIFSGLSTSTAFLPSTSTAKGEHANLSINNAGERLFFSQSGQLVPTATGATYEAIVRWKVEPPPQRLTQVDLLIISPPGTENNPALDTYSFASVIRQTAASAAAPPPSQ